MVLCFFHLFNKCFESILPWVFDVEEIDRRKEPEKGIDIPFAGTGDIEMQLRIKGCEKRDVNALNSLPDQDGGEGLFERRILDFHCFF